MYEIYPCDLTLFGECPKRCQDCVNCEPSGYYTIEDDDDEPSCE